MNSFSKTNFTKAFYIIVFLVPTFFLAMSFQKGKGGKELKIGKKAPLSSIKMKSTDDSEYSLESIKGKNGFIVIFSCNTCPFVVGSDKFVGWEGQYNDIHAKAKENDMGLILVNSNVAKRGDVDSMEEMKKHSDEQGYTMPYVVDKDAKMANAFGAKTTPHVYVFDKDIKLAYRGSIDNSWDTKRTELHAYLLDAIANMGTGKSIETTTTTARGCSIKRTKK